ncbi:cupin domain-containing protein [Pelagicoccus mobilis]|uniref:Cupin domain-containing protein n=1 Tax=Pelagicoccus mobilis TaxID=415221 RepID=A0A934RUS1_9BACT|nr:cupin domain-containing protein [Pelagicoccus mobilis]MBK1876793.1 cupin domain-containing protein [Pelagicoccus mobilis]
MKKRYAFSFFALAGLASSLAFGHPQHESDTVPKASELKVDNLLRNPLAGAEGLEVIMSHVSIPPNTSLPKHWHPGEEFAYILAGNVTLWQEGKEDIHFKAGDAAMVPLKQIHTAITGDEGVTLLIFRVHQQGKPERVLVD